MADKEKFKFHFIKKKGNSRGNQGSGANNTNLMKYECVCPNCSRNVAAIRFAPHLEKCNHQK